MAAGSGLTERQQKWLASVQASLERDTGKTIDEWVAIARTCPETRPKAREKWLKEQHGLGINRASFVLSQAFPSDDRWDQPEALREKLWIDPASKAVLEALEQAASALGAIVVGQRTGFTVFSRNVAFAAVRPLKGGRAALGLALDPDADPRLSARKNDGWSERLKSRLELASAAHVDERVHDLLRRAWERS